MLVKNWSLTRSLKNVPNNICHASKTLQNLASNLLLVNIINPYTTQGAPKCKHKRSDVRSPCGGLNQLLGQPFQQVLRCADCILYQKVTSLPYQMCQWCNGYRRRKWTRRHEFKSWTILIAFHIALIPLGKV